MRDIKPALWAAAATVGVLAHASTFAALQVLEPQVSSSAGIISDYAATESGWLVRVAFLLFAGVWAAVALGLGGVRPASRLLRGGRGLLGFAVVGITVVAVVPASADPRTGTALARFANLISRPVLFTGVLLVSLALLVHPDWKRVGRTLTVLAALGVSVLVVTVGYLLEHDLGGVGQRAAFVVLYVWVALFSRAMSKHALARRGLGGRGTLQEERTAPRSRRVAE